MFANSPTVTFLSINTCKIAFVLKKPKKKRPWPIFRHSPTCSQSLWKLAPGPLLAVITILVLRLQNPVRLVGPQPFHGQQLVMPLYLPGVNLLHICAKAASPPNQVRDIHRNISSGMGGHYSWEKVICNHASFVVGPCHFRVCSSSPRQRISAIFRLFFFSASLMHEVYRPECDRM